MYVQVMPEQDAEKVPYHPFDLTKVWPHADYPLIEVGEFELNRNPENFFLDVEQARLRPEQPGARHRRSPDRMLQARLFNYADAQRYRLGTNYQQIPVNAARCPVHSNHRDGQGRVDANYGAAPHYEPNSFGQWQARPEFAEPPLKITATPNSGRTTRTTPTTSSSRASCSADDARAAAGPVRQHRPRHGRRARVRQVPPHPQLPRGRPGLWCRRGQGAGAGPGAGAGLAKTTRCMATRWSPCPSDFSRHHPGTRS
jgi:hypothetical protein